MAGSMSIENRYELGPRLWTEGGVEAYVALDTDSGEPVSAFLFPRARTAAPHALAAFQQLGRRLSTLSHPSLLEVLSIGVADGVGYLIAADIEGTPFARLLERADRPSLGQLLETVPGLLDGLALGHAAGFHHGKLGAERVYLSEGHAVLVGFGLVQLERALEYGAYQLDLGNEDRVGRDRAAVAALSGALVASGAARPSSPAARVTKPPVVAAAPAAPPTPALAPAPVAPPPHAAVAVAPRVAAVPARAQAPIGGPRPPVSRAPLPVQRAASLALAPVAPPRAPAPRTAPPPPVGMPMVQRAAIGAAQAQAKRFPADFEDETTGYGRRFGAAPSAPWSMSAQLLAICSVTLAMAILILTTA